MKFSDFFSSILLFAFAGVLWFSAQQLPNPGDQLYGPSFFPSCIAAIMALCAGILAVSSLRNQMIATDKTAWVQLDSWTRNFKSVGRFLLVPASIILYVYGVEYFGFILTSTLILLILFLALGVGRLQSLIIAIGVALLVHALFDLGLRVPLPRGDLFFD